MRVEQRLTHKAKRFTAFPILLSYSYDLWHEKESIDESLRLWSACERFLEAEAASPLRKGIKHVRDAPDTTKTSTRRIHSNSCPWPRQ